MIQSFGSSGDSSHQTVKNTTLNIMDVIMDLIEIIVVENEIIFLIKIIGDVMDVAYLV